MEEVFSNTGDWEKLELIKKSQMGSFLFFTIVLGVSLTITTFNSCFVAVLLKIFLRRREHTTPEEKEKERKKKRRRRQRAAKILQHTFRTYRSKKTSLGSIVNKVLTQREELRELAAVLIQADWRRHIAWKSYKLWQRQHRQEEAEVRVILLQRMFRRFLARQRERRAEKQQRESARILSGFTSLQCLVRVFLARRRREKLETEKQQREHAKVNSAVTSLQSSYRGRKVRAEQRRLETGTVLAQSSYRGRKVRAEQRRLEKGTILAQSLYRGGKVRSELKHAAVLIQRIVRGFHARQTFERKQRAATIIQRLRRYQVARRLWIGLIVESRHRDRDKMHSSATKIQGISRCHLAKKQLESLKQNKMKAAAITIQTLCRIRKARALRAQLHVEKQALKVKAFAATIIQALVRRFLKRRAYLQALALLEAEDAVAKLQATHRMHLARRQLHLALGMIRRIQRIYRGHLARKQFAELHHKAKHDKVLKYVIMVQAHIRGYFARSEYMMLICKENAFNQVFRYDVSIRRLLHGNLEKLHHIYSQYLKYPEQALSLDNAIALGKDFQLVPDLTSIREFRDTVNQVTSRNKNTKQTGKKVKALMSFEQFLKMLILLAMKHVETDTHHTVMHRFERLMVFMNNTEGFQRISKKRGGSFVSRFILFESPDLPSASEVKNLDLVKALKKKSRPRRSPRHNLSVRTTSLTGSEGSLDSPATPIRSRSFVGRLASSTPSQTRTSSMTSGSPRPTNVKRSLSTRKARKGSHQDFSSLGTPLAQGNPPRSELSENRR